MISVKDLCKSYGSRRILQGLSFEVEPGTVFGLLGHNGAGKSTTIDCVLGVEPFESGEVSVLSQDPAVNRKSLFQKVGVQFQNTAYPTKIKVKEACELNHSLYEAADDWRILLEQFGLGEKANAYVADLSGGERQKLAIVLAVMHRPELVFLDELTTGLDPYARREVWTYIKALKASGTTVFLTSHFMDEVEQLCDKIAILKAGKILISGTVSQVVEKSGKTHLEDAYLYFVEGI